MLDSNRSSGQTIHRLLAVSEVREREGVAIYDTMYHTASMIAKTTFPRGLVEDWLDRAATVASLLCLLHCLALPLLIAALPSLAKVLDVPESFHMAVVIFALPSSLLALLSGKAKHRSPLPLLVGLAGLAALIVALALLHDSALETPATVVGSVALAAAHVWNWRLRHAGAKNLARSNEML